MYGVCNLSIIPVRAEASDKSELVTQLLFGDAYTIIQTEEKWLKIRIAYDDYEGWIDRIMHYAVDSGYFDAYKVENHPILHKYSTLVYKGSVFFPVLLGSVLPFYDGEFIKLGKEELLVDSKQKSLDTIKDTAFMYYNSPYLWGGKTPYGIDCSGFTQQVYKLHGIKIPRDASQQYLIGDEVAFGQHQENDLAFYQNKDGKVTHVGIVLEDNKIIHAHGKVRVDIMDEHGIYNVDRKEYSHRFKGIKRY